MDATTHYLYVGFGIVIFVELGGWVYSLANRSQVRHAEELKARKAAHQPWGDDQPRGRGAH